VAYWKIFRMLDLNLFPTFAVYKYDEAPGTVGSSSSPLSPLFTNMSTQTKPKKDAKAFAADFLMVSAPYPFLLHCSVCA